MRFKLIISSILLVGVLLSCNKDEPENPYASITPTVSNPTNIITIPSDNFAWLQAKIFKPTCANSGCHDGTFEPEFNTIASSYNSLVNHPVITNNEAESFEYRVVPNSASTSLLNERLTVFIPNTSGVMPLEVDGDSDWLSEQDNYILKIQQWINSGAKDMFGNPAPSADANFPPQASGFVVFPNGNTTDPFIRDPEEVDITPILVDATIIDLWLAVSDDETDPESMNQNSVKLSMDVELFDEETSYNYTVETGISALDFSNAPTTFYHKATVDLSDAETGDTFFVRNYLDDFSQSSETEIPNAGSNAVTTALFVLKVQ